MGLSFFFLSIVTTVLKTVEISPASAHQHPVCLSFATAIKILASGNRPAGKFTRGNERIDEKVRGWDMG